MPKHLLIVEDNEQDLELARVALELSDLRCEVTVAQDGAEALDFLFRWGRSAGPPARHPDLMLLDLNMPRVNGREVLAAVKAHPAWRSVPVVIFTTSDEASDRAACLAAGADDYVLKPDGFEALVETFNRLGRRWLGAEQAVSGVGT